MKRITLIIFTVFLFAGCQTVFDNQGKLRAIAVARNVYLSSCGDCDFTVVEATEQQSGIIGQVFTGFFSTVKAIATGLIPRGIGNP